MGQQQLLLVILVTIIVGIATVVAINTFSSAADTANLDAVRNDVAAIAASAQGYYIRPAMLGGGGNSFAGLTFNQITFPGTIDGTSNLIAANANGGFVIAVAADGTSFTITAYPASEGGVTSSTPDATTGAVTYTVNTGGPNIAATVFANSIQWTNSANLN